MCLFNYLLIISHIYFFARGPFRVGDDLELLENLMVSNNSNNSKRADQVEIEKIPGQARVETAHPYGVAQNTTKTATHIAEAQLATLNFQDPIF